MRGLFRVFLLHQCSLADGRHAIRNVGELDRVSVVGESGQINEDFLITLVLHPPFLPFMLGQAVTFFHSLFRRTNWEILAEDNSLTNKNARS